MSDWKLSFRYRKCFNIDIRFHSNIYIKEKKVIRPVGFEPAALEIECVRYTSQLRASLKVIMSDILYLIKNFFRYPMSLLCSLSQYRRFQYQARSNIRLSLISPITDIGLSAHLCPELRCSSLNLTGEGFSGGNNNHKDCKLILIFCFGVTAHSA